MRRRTICMVLSIGSLAAVHCKPSEPAQPPAPPAAKVAQVETAPAAAPVPLQPPTQAFVAPQAWVSRKPGKNTPIEPPDLDQETWRVLVTQNKPLQRKTPLWQALPAREMVELNMPEGVGFRCVVQPVRVTTLADDFNYKLKGWGLTRSLLCSSDQWQSWNEYVYSGLVQPDGTRVFPDEVGALLREQAPDQSVRHTFAMMRSDKEKRQATYGAPQILTGMKVDED
jgi:hypothetical protein